MGKTARMRILVAILIILLTTVGDPTWKVRLKNRFGKG
jgi:hypothetical protein